jgi:hypothetical protein
MSENTLETIERLEKLAAWHRISAERAGADWVWEARLRAAEDLEGQAAKLRARSDSGYSVEAAIVGLRARHGAALVNAYRDRNYRVVATARSVKPSRD